MTASNEEKSLTETHDPLPAVQEQDREQAMHGTQKNFRISFSHLLFLDEVYPPVRFTGPKCGPTGAERLGTWERHG